MSDFKVKFRGVRGSFPVANNLFLQYGGNTSCVEINVGGHIIILDAGTGIVNVGDELLEKYISSSINPAERKPIISTILLSHIHQDHLMGLTFFKPIHLKSSIINIFGPKDDENNLNEDLSHLIFGKTFPVDLGDIAGQMNINNLEYDTVLQFKPNKTPIVVKKDKLKKGKNDVIVSFFKSYVHPQSGVVIYKIEYKDKSLVYATDKECFVGGDKIFTKFAKNCDLLIHDAQYTSEDYMNPYAPKQGFGHSTFDMAVEAMQQTKAKNLVFFHLNPDYDDKKLNHIKEHYTTNYKNSQIAYEGLEYNLI